ncbi:hypothetical protein N7532_005225 [Penicillium argentinense]|uniref:DNA-directed RNA polymerase n=1 Tax=Penicillium argentinense TaxID=1131581 RepID=A0A9W9FDR1_9EURO|nr:uncharacterized protein N7532_005225 [Penicillium argentinense]KAJ5098224.1 hypothetical protein N7532_005225 [Penicillium argentinense]
MLSRVARQKNALFHLRKAHAHQALGASSIPRLHSTSTRLNPAAIPKTHSNPERRRRPSLQSLRSLATATDPPTFEHNSFMSLNETSVERMSAIDTSSLIIINQTPQTQPKIFRKVRGIGGDLSEMLANFDMSLKVGRFDRASVLLNRLETYYTANSSEYRSLHNRYLKEMVAYMIATREEEMIMPLQKWFETDMPAADVKPDATTFAIMIRMALRMLDGSKRERTVRRYWNFAKQAGLHEDLLAVEVLTDLDLGELSRICFADLYPVNLELVTEEHTAKQIDDIPNVLAAEQKGLGLSSLMESLSLFKENPRFALPEDFNGTEEEKEELQNQLRQRQLERDTINASMNRWRAEFMSRTQAGIDVTTGKKSINSVVSQWHNALVSKIEEEVKLGMEAETQPIRTEIQARRLEHLVFLQSMSGDRLAALTILAVMSTFSRGGMEKGIKLSAVASTIGREVQQELVAQEILKQETNSSPTRTKMLKEMLADRKGKDGRLRWKAISEKMQTENESLAWTPRVQVRLGAVLMSLLLEVGKVPVRNTDSNTQKRTTVMQPAFHHSYQITFGKRAGLVHLHPSLVKMMVQEPAVDLLGRHLPMICKPKAWTGAKEGAYMIYKSNLIRSTPGELLQPKYIDAAMKETGLTEIRQGLDVLGSTGWAVNREVFDVMLEAWNSGEGVASLAPLEPDLPAPPKPDPEAGHAAEKEWQTRMREIENLRSGYHSVRCFQNFQMEVARSFRNETFYLPHNMDFRGRAYPLPPYLNQMGADNSRGLLLFSDAKPLGVNGLRWLKIQLANLYGFDKASMAEREQFAMDHLDDILDSANNGLKGKRWWIKAADPWQCLAACIELRNALRYSDPTEYPSRLPIHQDGSCNGLQHYAALGGDIVGAKQVNLEPSDRPSDVYTGVSEFVKEAVAKEAEEGLEIAKILNGKITRKIVKQTVMTNVYGVTFMGAMRQVRKQLIDHYPELSTEEKKQGALYIARKIFQALSSMFNGAHDIQYWLGNCANRITQSLSPEEIEDFANRALSPKDSDTKVDAKSLDPTRAFRSTVIWTTPLGLPVVQPYRSRKARRVQTTLQDLSIVDPSSNDVISRRKQLQAFPPNFIHSLDATHMMLSANACHKAGLTFSAVHDSFWTHASDVDTMNEILRDAFVKMHSDDVIGRLAAEFHVRYGKHLFLTRVSLKSAVGRAISKHRKEVSMKKGKVGELVEEHRRQTLLRSSDPYEQAKGREMVTAASIFEEMGGTEADFANTSTLGETKVGHVPEDLAVAEKRPGATVVDNSDPAIQSLFEDVELMDTQHETLAEPDEEVKKKRRDPHTVWIWMPMRFPDVPTKGSWDVSRIRKSEYFFS